MSRPTLTAVLPNRNHSQYLPQAIEAVASQSRPPDEFIVLDDASTDNSVEVIEDYCQRYQFMRLVRNERGLGVVAALNRLVSTATGDYVYCGAADDYVLPRFFESAMAMAETYPQAGVIFGKVVVTNHVGEEIAVVGVRRWRQPRFASPERFLREYLKVEYVEHSLTCATIYRRAALEEIGNFRQELGYWTDTFAIRTIALKHGACYVPAPWATWRVMPRSFSVGQRSDRAVVFGILENAVALMRSPELRGRFPEDYVRRWKHDLEQMILNDYIWTLREPFGTSSWGLWKGRLLKHYLMLKVALRYRGNVAAYIESQQKGS